MKCTCVFLLSSKISFFLATCCFPPTLCALLYKRSATHYFLHKVFFFQGTFNCPHSFYLHPTYLLPTVFLSHFYFLHFEKKKSGFTLIFAWWDEKRRSLSLQNNSCFRYLSNSVVQNELLMWIHSKSLFQNPYRNFLKSANSQQQYQVFQSTLCICLNAFNTSTLSTKLFGTKIFLS